MKNEVIVGEESEAYKKEISINDVNYLIREPIEKPFKAQIKTRYSAKMASATVFEDKIVFDEPQKALTPGQSAVFYIDNVVIGGGKIA